MRALRLDRVALNVRDLAQATAFYTGALGFLAAPAQRLDPAQARLLGAQSARSVRLRRGAQTLELVQCTPAGAPTPAHTRSNDLWFQHCALATGDIHAAYATLLNFAFTPISRNGPQALPGGIVAYKFRDADGHPLELIQFPQADPATRDGIDHSAIAVSDAASSIAFYQDTLGLAVHSRQVNTGPAQDALDDLASACVDVIGLSPAAPAPHVELLGYRTPRGRPAAGLKPSDIAATRLVFAVDRIEASVPSVTLADQSRSALIHDPDGHALLLEQRP